jgi:hypothetical protein
MAGLRLWHCGTSITTPVHFELPVSSGTITATAAATVTTGAPAIAASAR